MHTQSTVVLAEESIEEKNFRYLFQDEIAMDFRELENMPSFHICSVRSRSGRKHMLGCVTRAYESVMYGP